MITARVHPFPSRTRKLSSFVPKILGWKRPGKIGVRQHRGRSLMRSSFCFWSCFWLTRESQTLALHLAWESPGTGLRGFHNALGLDARESSPKYAESALGIPQYLEVLKKLNFFAKNTCIFWRAVVLYWSSRENRSRIVGVDYGEGPPVPIPNTEVKLVRAEDTWLEAAWKNRCSPTHKLLQQ